MYNYKWNCSLRSTGDFVTIIQSASAENLDRQLPDFQVAAQTLRARPPMGWIAAIRTALGMSLTALAKRLGVSHSTLLAYEKGEVTGSIQIETLRRVADALDAELIVALVPRKSIKATLTERAREIASDEMQAVTQTMRLENQEVKPAATEAEFEKLVQTLLTQPRKLWR